jgi:hypothetical protein
MKKLYTIIAVLFVSASVFGQAPASFKYQAVLRDARGNVKANTSTTILISILSGSATGDAVYTETHSVKTDGYGLVNLEIGNGTPTHGTMSAIDWSDGVYFIKTTVDGVVMGTNQLLSVPFAQYANRAANGLSKADSVKLAGIAPGAEVNVNADWNAVSGDAQILNKPVFANADWNATSGAAQILNKPTIGTLDGSETKVNPGTNITVTGTGTTANPYVINGKTHTLGEEYQGGIVFYVYDGGQHGLIAAKEDLPGDEYGVYPWFIIYDGEGTLFNFSGAVGDGIGAGERNTSLIISSQSSYNFTVSLYAGNFPPLDFAAQACIAYSATDANEVVFGNWYLPSKYELDLLFKSQENVATLNLLQALYWSSTEIDEYDAWAQDFYEGTQSSGGDGSKLWRTAHVRPIKAF